MPDNPSTKDKYKIAMVVPTPYYWQVPLFPKMNDHPRIDLMVYYCSDEALSSMDVQKSYKSEGSWGVDDQLLDGYQYKFLKNYSPRPTYMKSGIGLVNLGIWGEIKRERPDMVCIQAWTNPTWWLAVLACLRYGVPYFFMTDANIQNESVRPPWKRALKRILLGKLLFPRTGGFLNSGIANERMYDYYGADRAKFIPFAYSWGYEDVLDISAVLTPQKTRLRAGLGIPEDDFVILFSGRLIREKSLFDLIDAFQLLKDPKKKLVIVGDGEMRQELEEYAADRCPNSVQFFGFQNRQEIMKFHAMSDALVLPSRQETWGIVVNEAMCFRLPVIVSHQVGASEDMVRDGDNGFVFPHGDIKALSSNLQTLSNLGKEGRAAMGESSLRSVTEWTNRDLLGGLVAYLDRKTESKSIARS